MILDASLATYVPLIPMANPTSAFWGAGASLVPSPVTATMLFMSSRPVTKAYLSSGRERAKTDSLGAILENYSMLSIVSTLRLLLFFLASSRDLSH